MSSQTTTSPALWTIARIDRYLLPQSITSREFWRAALGGDSAPLPSATVQTICREIVAERWYDGYVVIGE